MGVNQARRDGPVVRVCGSRADFLPGGKKSGRAAARSGHSVPARQRLRGEVPVSHERGVRWGRPRTRREGRGPSEGMHPDGTT